MCIENCADGPRQAGSRSRATYPVGPHDGTHPTSDELLERVARRATGTIGLEEAVVDLRGIRAER